MSSLIRSLFVALAIVGLSLPAVAQFRTDRPILGVSLHTEGLPIRSVDADSLGAAAGFRAGDFLTHWNGKPTPSIEAVIAIRDESKAGSTAQFQVLRGAERVELQIALPDPMPEDGVVLGLNVGAGLYVASVVPDSPAAKAGIRAGDVLERMARSPLADVGALRAELDRVHWGESREFVVIRDGQSRTVSVAFDAPRIFATPMPPMGAPYLGGRLPQAADWHSTLLGLDEVQKGIDEAVAELRALGDPRLDATIAKLESQSKRLATVAKPLGALKELGRDLQRDLNGLQNMPFGGEFEFGEIESKLQELMERYGDDLEALREAFNKEFPGMSVMIDRGDGPINLNGPKAEKKATEAPKKLEVLEAEAAEETAPEAKEPSAEKKSPAPESEPKKD